MNIFFQSPENCSGVPCWCRRQKHLTEVMQATVDRAGPTLLGKNRSYGFNPNREATSRASYSAGSLCVMLDKPRWRCFHRPVQRLRRRSCLTVGLRRQLVYFDVSSIQELHSHLVPFSLLMHHLFSHPQREPVQEHPQFLLKIS